MDGGGEESALSFVVRAVIAATAASVTLAGLSFAPGTAAFHVYRGPRRRSCSASRPIRRSRRSSPIRDWQKQLVPPPDANFDHANFYWRLELQPENAATIHSPDTVGNGTLEMAVNRIAA